MPEDIEAGLWNWILIVSLSKYVILDKCFDLFVNQIVSILKQVTLPLEGVGELRTPSAP